MDLYKIRNLLSAGKSIYELPLRVTYYARVSTDKYEQANSLKNQIDYFKRLIEDNPNWIYADGYVDEGISGTIVNKRESFLRMIHDAQKGDFDFIITKEISRFSRNTLDSIKYTQELLSCGVGVLFQSDNINTLLPDSELRLTIMSSIAQEEVRKISERVKFGFKRSIENGRVLGNDCIWGYKKEDGKLVILPEEAEIVRLIYELYVTEKMGLRTLSSELANRGILNRNGNEFSYSTLRSVLSNPKYKGYYCGNKSKVVDYKLKNRALLSQDEWVQYRDEENVPAIVDEKIWNEANRLLNERGKKAGRHAQGFQNRYSYSGKLFCGEHKTSFHRTVFKNKSGSFEVWQCKVYREKGRDGCRSPTVYSYELNYILLEIMNRIFDNRKDIIKSMAARIQKENSGSDYEKSIESKGNDIKKIMKKKDKLLELSTDGRLSNEEFETRNKGMNDEISKMKGEIENLLEIKKRRKDIEKDLSGIEEKISGLLQKSDSINPELALCLIDKIIVDSDYNDEIIRLRIILNIGIECRAEYSHHELHFVSDNTYAQG